MIRFFSLLLSVMLVLPFAMCAGQNETSGEQTSTPTVTESGTDSEHASSSTTDETDTDTEPASVSADIGDFSKAGEISETVLVDENDVKITATKIDYSSYSLKISLLIENNSDEDLTFICGSMGYSCNSVNGFMIEDGYLNCDVDSGKKTNDTVEFDYDNLMMYGITEIADVELGFDIRDDDYNHFYTGPRQIKTSIADGYSYDEKGFQKTFVSPACIGYYGYTINHFSAERMFENDAVSIESVSLFTNKNDDQTFLFETVNKLSEQIILTVSGVKVNGIVFDDSIWTTATINVGKRCVIDISLANLIDDSYREILGIDEVGEISFDVAVLDSDGGTISKDETITATFPGAKTGFSLEGIDVYSNNDIRITVVGLTEDSHSYSDDIYLVFVVENAGTKTIKIDDEYDSFSVNDYMCDYLTYGCTAKPGETVVMDIRIDRSSLEENGINEVEEIEKAEIEIRIRDDKWKDIDKAKLVIDF